jgi:hypothetical protein
MEIQKAASSVVSRVDLRVLYSAAQMAEKMVGHSAVPKVEWRAGSRAG